jgi:NAD(P)-dependent dehydrogenase (short-subunit alcohol dehydrogenase family)
MMTLTGSDKAQVVGRIAGKVALITGGCSGIGLATAELFVSEGARVLVADIQDAAGALLEQRFAGKIAYRHCDVRHEADIQASLAAAAAEFGGLDILFNNAGKGGAPGGAAGMSAQAWDDTQALLLRGPMLGIKHAIPLMKARGGGSIINNASIAAFEAGWGLAYGVAKAGVVHLTKAAAAELAVFNIRVNAICPGVIVTPILRASGHASEPTPDRSAPEIVAAAAQMQPLRRAGLPKDIALAALYLASEDSSFVTGTAQIVDGGLTAGKREAWDQTVLSPLQRAIAATKA